MKLLLALVVIVCVAMAVTNPGAEAHKEVFYANLPKEAGATGVWQKLAGSFLEGLDKAPLEYWSTMTQGMDALRLKRH